jgi:putative endonuclease
VDEPDDWYVYVLVSGDETRTYVGIARDPEIRLLAHNGERPGGAKATRPGRPWSIGRTLGPYGGRAEAQKAEWQLKQRRGLDRLHSAEE